MSILEMLSRQLDSRTVQEIGRQAGIDEDTAGRAVAGALPMLVSALASNANRPEGAASLTQALERDHDGSVLDDVPGALSRLGTDEGMGILGHVLGTRRDAAATGLGQASGVDRDTMLKVLAMVAPLVLGALGRKRREASLGAPDLSDLLQQERRQATRTAPGASGLVASLLDADGDGQVLDDVARLGGGLLGGMFGKRR